MATSRYCSTATRSAIRCISFASASVHGAMLGGDPEQGVGLAGDSAGGALAVLAAVQLRDAGTPAASLLLGFLAGASDPWFEAVRRVPALAAALAVVALLRSRIAQSGASAEMPLLPRQIDWVRAAGNYIELRASGRTIVHRSSIGAAERDLAKHGFVRIHRSTLVRRDRIAR